MWLRAEIDESKEYCVALCQQSNGRRHYKLLVVGEAAPSESVFITEVVPVSLLLRRHFIGIAETVKLTNGHSFGVEAHGVWLTKQECDALNAGTEWDNTPWLNGLPPNLPPR